MMIIGHSRPQAAEGAATAPMLGASTSTTAAAIWSGRPEDTSVTVDLTGLGLSEGDLVLVGCSSQQMLSGGNDTGGVQAGQGYTDIVAKSVTKEPGHHISCKPMGSVPDSSVVIDRNHKRAQIVIVQVVRQVDLISPMDGPVASATGAAGSGMPDGPGYATQTAGCLRVIFGAISGSDVTAAAPIAAPSGWTGLVVRGDGSQSAGTAMFAFRETAAVGPDDPASFGGVNAAEPWAAFHFALRGRPA